jgi:hypothetical protein
MVAGSTRALRGAVSSGDGASEAEGSVTCRFGRNSASAASRASVILTARENHRREFGPVILQSFPEPSYSTALKILEDYG